MSSSSIPTLSDILFYTSTDSYDYLTDNRPIQQLSDNIKATAAALVGVGYGEHSSISGALLPAGKAVELQLNGNIAYPTSTPKTGIYGIVIGSTNGGLNKVIWRSDLLDLEVFGLQGLISGAVPGQILKIDTSTTNGLFSAVGAGSILSTDAVLGTVLASPYITIGSITSSSSSIDASAKENLLHNFGLTRKQNFSLFAAIDATPIQFSKETIRAPKTINGSLKYNPLNITLSLSTGQVTIDTITADPTNYANVPWILKEKYTRLLVNNVTPVPDVSVQVVGSSTTTFPNFWSSIAYPVSFPVTNTENFELSSTSVASLQNFSISKYYQYPQATGSLSTKPVVIVTVLDPFASGGSNDGGETGRLVVIDFITYDNGGYETNKRRVTLVGSAANGFYNAFPSDLIAL
jgi:hypothetical protein